MPSGTICKGKGQTWAKLTAYGDAAAIVPEPVDPTPAPS